MEPTYLLRPYEEKKCVAGQAALRALRTLVVGAPLWTAAAGARPPSSLFFSPLLHAHAHKHPRKTPFRCRTRFSPSAARAISEEVCASILAGKVWTGEGEEVVWTVQITESVKEKVKGAFFGALGRRTAGLDGLRASSRRLVGAPS